MNLFLVVNVDYLVLEKVNLVVKQSNLLSARKKLFGCRKIVAKQFIIVLDSVYLVVQKFIAFFLSVKLGCRFVSMMSVDPIISYI